jgi:DNA-directed RNA polymerase subunit beta'
LEYGSVILVNDKQVIKQGAKIAEWEPNNKVLVTEKAGYVQFVDLIENVTIQERYEEGGQAANMVLDHKGEKYQPALSIMDNADQELAQYYLPSGSYLNVKQGAQVSVGDILVKVPREASKSKDITGSLPRIAELFEARAPKDVAIIADINGEVVFGGLHRGLRKVSIVSGTESFDYFVPRSKQLNVGNGDRVTAGDQLTSGVPILHDLLRILGPDVVQKYLVEQIQQIYRLQGIDLNDKHIEVIARQMLRKVRVIDPGDTDFLIGDRVDRIHFQTVNAVLKAQGKKPALAKSILMGITQASLGTESFISAASFQETTRILAEAAISGQIDNLYGLKENVIVGKLIPAGTGIKSFKDKYLGIDVSDLERKAQEEEMRSRASRNAAN